MNRWRLIFRTLLFFRAANIAVMAGMAVATAVLTGALLVGDSVRGSLRELTLQRLGPIDHAMMSMGFVGEDLAGRIAGDTRFKERFSNCVAGLYVRGGASNEGGSARASGVNVFGMGQSAWFKAAEGAMINGELADLLGVGAGQTIVLTLPTAENTPGDATFARRSRTDVTTGMRARVSGIARVPGVISLFDLAPSQRTPLNAWVGLKDLQNAIGQPGKANLLLVEGKGSAGSAEPLNEILRDVVRLSDYGLSLGKSGDGREAVLNSATTYILPEVDRAAEEVAGQMGVALRRVSVYLANQVTKLAREGSGASVIHYAIVAGLSDIDGQKLRPDEIALNAWTAEQLEAKVGDQIRFAYYQRKSNGELEQVRSDRPGVGLVFRVARIVAMEGLGADRTLTPEYKGFTDADTIADWQPPQGVEIDKKLVTPADEAYWEKYRAAPKLFVSLETARKLWGNVYGDLTSIRVPAAKAEEFGQKLREKINPAAMGLGFRALKAEQLAAASGSTDFSMLFIGFSFFIIAAAGLLLAMLFRLAIEQRVRQYGLLAAIGFAPGAVWRVALIEAAVLAVIGGLIGVVLGIGYTALMIAGLRTWWFSAVGTSALRVHVAPASVVIGLVCSLLIALLAAVWAVRRISRGDAARLLRGTLESSAMRGEEAQRPRPPVLVLAIFLLAVGALGWGAFDPGMTQTAYMLGGALLLIGGLALVGRQLRHKRQAIVPVLVGWSVDWLALRNASRHRTRSILTVALIAFASFVLVTVSSMKQGPPTDVYQHKSGTGGYQLFLRADVPLTGDLNTPRGRDLLGVRESDSPLWRSATFTSMRSWAGQDASCLNLTRPQSPTILAVPAEMVERHAFEFARTIREVANPWTLLEEGGEGDDVPVIADNETATYILKLSVGQTLPITDQLGRQRNLKLVATLSHSIFQSELLMGERNFLRLFPSQSGFGVVLVEAPKSDVSALRRLLATELDDFSVSVETTADRLARYQEVANTYLSTFQALGSLGLMLGTIGLAVVMLRNLVERRPELALLTAIGFRPGSRLRLVLMENVLLLVLGLIVGAGSALIGVVPALISSSRSINVYQLVLTLSAVLAVGVGVLSLSVYFGARHVSPAALRAE